jgi:hypothetical protein
MFGFICYQWFQIFQILANQRYGLDIVVFIDLTVVAAAPPEKQPIPLEIRPRT